MVTLGSLRRRRSVGLDIGRGAIKALKVEGRGTRLQVTGIGVTPVELGADPGEIGHAVNTALASAGAEGDPVVTAIGGPEVIIRQVSLPSLPPNQIIPTLAFQHRELGLLPPEEAVIDAQVLRRSRDGASAEVLAVSVPRKLVEARTRLLQQAAVPVGVLDVEPLALLNGALHLSGFQTGDLLVTVTIGRQNTVLGLFSEQGPVVARYLDVGAGHFTEQLRAVPGLSPSPIPGITRSLAGADDPRAEEACRPIVDRIAGDIQLALAFYRTEYDREAIPRYAVGGWAGLPQIGKWLADRLGLTAPVEIMNPLQVLELRTRRFDIDAEPAGPQFLQAFGLALRGL
jgi:type IV pilus assembly protein PilM